MIASRAYFQQVDLTNTTYTNPVGPHASTVSIVTTTSESRLLKPRCWAPHGERPENPNVASIQHPPTPTPSVAGRDSKYRCKVVHSLPVSTTSYFRHAVSTVQTWSVRPTMVRSSNDTGEGYFPSISYPEPTFLRPVSTFLFSLIHSLAAFP